MKSSRFLLPGLFLMSIGVISGRELHMNEVQVIGTHNSYHLAPDAGMMKMLEIVSKRAIEAWGYSHETLDKQLDSGVRQFELDVFADPEGGLYAQENDHPEMKKPGAKVLHVPGLDFRTNHKTFVGALETVRDWSLKHPNHVPLMILVELKDSRDNPLAPPPVKFDRGQMEALENEIWSVFKRDHLLTPDGVRGDEKTLRDAILKRGWPLLKSARGKVMFGLDNEGGHRTVYLEGIPALENRVMFVSVDRAHPAAGWMKRNDPVGGFEEIQGLVKEGFLVRTRADADSREARANDHGRAKKALESGAQFVSTDYPRANPRIGEYEVALPGKVVARANPVAAPGGPAGELE